MQAGEGLNRGQGVTGWTPNVVGPGRSVLALAAGVLLASASTAFAQDIELELLQQQPHLTVELGKSPGRAGFALEIGGGLPHSFALLELRAESGSKVQRLVQLDGEGQARWVERNHELAQAIEVSCSLVDGETGERAVRTSVIPSAPSIVQASLNQSGAPLLGVGDIVITEFMKDPAFVSDSAGEWIEIRNRTSQPINLEGWVLSDAGSNTHTIHSANGVWVAPKSYFLLGINATPANNGGVSVGYKYSNFSLGNGADEIRLTDNLGTLIDVVAYDDGIFWPDDAGKSVSLDRALVDPVLNDDGANWCSALAPFSSANTDFGTPRVANNTCP
ncbi:MAG: lamin tail domain-containing protein [Planctomycetes bacterium]|nr:lamin tail domain-containing protein [Planctomycetota bacterium]